MMTDPRKAATLDEAARNPDGTYNGARALSWLSDVLTGGKGQTEDEVNRMFADAKAGKAKTAPAKGRCCSAAGVGRKSGAQGA